MNLWEPQGGRGWIEVIVGPMCSGKSEELQRRLRLAKHADKRVILLKPVQDTRDQQGESVSHVGRRMACLTIERPQQALICQRERNAEVVGFEEAQFYGDGFVAVCQELANRGVRVLVAGLTLDSSGRPFGEIPLLMAVAEVVDKRHAICTMCGGPASFSERLTGRGTGQVHIGGTGDYEPRCRRHFTGFVLA